MMRMIRKKPHHRRMAFLCLVTLFLASCGKSFPETRLDLPRPASAKLANGIEILSIEDKEFPLAEIQLFFRGGSSYDPSGKEGLAAVAMQAIRLGGMRGRAPASVEESLEFSGASLEVGTTAEYATVSLKILKKDLNAGLDLLFGLLTHPTMDPRIFDIVKTRAEEALKRDREDPMGLAQGEFPNYVYKGNPWGRRPTPESIHRITHKDVLNFWRMMIWDAPRPLIAAAGDMTSDAWYAAVESRTREWTKVSTDFPPLPAVQETYEPLTVVIPRKGLTQSSVIVGHLGGSRRDPERFATLVMNFILGGSGALTSRLGEEIRSNAGKAYSVGSDFGFGKDRGLFRAMGVTATENTLWVASKIAELIRKAAEAPDFRKDEVEKAKQAILRSLVFDFETPFDQVREQAKFRMLGYPDGYLDEFQKSVDAVTVNDVNRVAKTSLHPQGLTTLIVIEESRAQDLVDALKKDGPVQLRRLP